MDDDDQTPAPNPAPDAETIARALMAKRRAAMRKIMNGRALAKQGTDMEREGAAEMADVEAFERVYKNLPTTPEQMHALERAPSRWAGGSRVLETHLRNLAFHGGGEAADLSNMPLVMRNELMHGSKSQRDLVVMHCAQILANGEWRTTEELNELMIEAGVQLTAANPVQRISQILSTTKGFVNQRGRGWSLDRSPALSDLPDSERESEDPLRIETKRVLDKPDHRAR